jgi:3',5'-cyclic-AMP phosphodiesterase
MRILHLSDMHLTGAPGPNRDGVDPRESLRLILRDCYEIPDITLVVVTGDISDDGSLQSYKDAYAAIAAFAIERNIPCFLTTGNHDVRSSFARVLGSGHRSADGQDLSGEMLRSPDGECAASTLVEGYRIITLDSLVPGKTYGLISQAQLGWLRGILAQPAPRGTILAFHHPPVAVFGVEVQKKLALHNRDELAETIMGTDVRLVLCGHFHLQVYGQLGAVPVWVTPGVLNRIDLTVSPGAERAVRGAGATVVDLDSGGSPVIHTVHARDPLIGRVVYEAGADEVAGFIAKELAD